MTTVKIQEVWNGTRDSCYVYVLEGKILRHVGNYAIKTEKLEKYRFYEVPIENVRDKPVFVFKFSKKGICGVSKREIEDWINSSYPTGDLSHSLEDVIKELENYIFEIRDVELKRFVEALETMYKRMIDEIKDYFKRLNAELVLSGHAERVYDAIRDVRYCYFSCLAIPDDVRRKRSLRKVCEWIYQLWVLKLVCESLGATEIVKMSWQDKPRVWIEQGKPYPCCIVNTHYGYFACYFKPQAHELIRLSKMFTGNREFVRPDIAVVRINENEVKEIFYEWIINRFDFIVECKVRKINTRDLKQITTYIDDFQPNALILASLERTLNSTRITLNSRDAIIVDGLNPNDPEKVKLFKIYVRDQFKFVLTSVNGVENRLSHF